MIADSKDQLITDVEAEVRQAESDLTARSKDPLGLIGAGAFDVYRWLPQVSGGKWAKYGCVVGTAYRGCWPEEGVTQQQPTGPVPPGGQLKLQGGKFAPNEAVNIDLHSTPVRLATVTVPDTREVVDTVTIPLDTAPGAHVITLTGTGTHIVQSLSITVCTPTDTSAQAACGTLANTGTNDSAQLCALGAALLALGLAMLRRRRPVRDRAAR